MDYDLDNIPKWIHDATYADDLVILRSEEYITTATVRVQEALKRLEAWTKKWWEPSMPEKTTYTIFSLAILLQKNREISPSELTHAALGQKTNLLWNSIRSKDDMKQQIDKHTARARPRTAFMKKLEHPGEQTTKYRENYM